MSEAVNRCWIGLGGGQAPKLCIGGGDAMEMRQNIAALFGGDMVEIMLNYFANEAETSVHRAAKQAAMDAGIVAGPTKGATGAPTAPATTSQGSPASDNSATAPANSAPSEEKDKYDNVFTYNVPGAPSCPHGPRVRKAGKSRAGKDYVGWTCVTQTPYAQRSGIPKDDGCKMEWA